MIYCPNCGSGHYESNRIDETPYLEAAREAEYLRHYGQIELAVHALSELSTVQIENFTRRRWRCMRCETSYD